jgi:dihydroxyacid dehydratase/phosphogluconate dehydratase
MATALTKAKGTCNFPESNKGGWGNRFAMDVRTSIKGGLPLPIRHVTRRLERAPHRSHLYAMELPAGEQVMEISGSTNAAPHLPAVAHECGTEFDSFDATEIFKKTPYAADLKPGGRYVAKDMLDVGGIPLLMKTLLDNGHLHGNCLTVTGRTIAENLKSVKWNPHQDVVRSADKPITVIGLKGNPAPEGAIVKVAGMSNVITDGRFSGATRGCCAGHVGPEAALGLLPDVEIDADVGTLNVKLTGAELAERKTKWKPRATNHTSGALWKYAHQVGPAVDGAVTDPGGAHEKQCYADI